MTNPKEKIINISKERVSSLNNYLSENYGYSGHSGDGQNSMEIHYQNGLSLKTINESDTETNYQLIIKNSGNFHQKELKALERLAGRK